MLLHTTFVRPKLKITSHGSYLHLTDARLPLTQTYVQVSATLGLLADPVSHIFGCPSLYGPTIWLALIVEKIVQHTDWFIWPCVADPFTEIAGILGYVLSFFVGWRSIEQLVCFRFVSIELKRFLVSATELCLILSTVTVFCLITGLVDLGSIGDCPYDMGARGNAVDEQAALALTLIRVGCAFGSFSLGFFYTAD